jgi:DNA-binding GntR family transcriptional regulator
LCNNYAVQQNSPLRTVSTVRALADELRQLILDGAVAPAEGLREMAYAERYGVGRHTFRAAAQLLVHQGLLRNAPNRGVFVPTLGADDVADVFRIRRVLELEAVRSVVAADQVPDAARSAVDSLTALGPDATWRAVVDADLRFHRALIDAAGSPRLSAAYDAVESEVILGMVQLRAHYQRPSEVAAEHEELLGLIVAGDLAAAEAGFTSHLDSAVANLNSTDAKRKDQAA